MTTRLPRVTAVTVEKLVKFWPVTVNVLPATPLAGLTVMLAAGTAWVAEVEAVTAAGPVTVAVMVLVEGMPRPEGTVNCTEKVPELSGVALTVVADPPGTG